MRLFLVLFFLVTSFSVTSSATGGTASCSDSLVPDPASENTLDYFSTIFEVADIDAKHFEARLINEGEGQWRLLIFAHNDKGDVVGSFDKIYNRGNNKLDGVFNLIINPKKWWGLGPKEVHQVLFDRGHLRGFHYYKYNPFTGRKFRKVLVSFYTELGLDDLRQIFESREPGR